MRLEELARRHRYWPHHGVPEWALGCFRRRSITFFTGETDSATHVWWLQTRGLSADLRIQSTRPDLRGKSGLSELRADERIALAREEGGIAETGWDGAVMTWSNWTAFQIHDKWAEPAQLKRVGDCLMEFAPSGAYVEDWRLQPSADGPLIGLRLLDERDAATNKVLHRGGGLIVCGKHAAFVRGRPRTLPAAADLAELVQLRGDNSVLMDEVFCFEASYGVQEEPEAPYIVALSTNPLREGQVLLDLDGFEYETGSNTVIQSSRSNGSPVERVFIIDTLEHSFSFPASTPVSEEGRNWLYREADTLLSAAGV